MLEAAHYERTGRGGARNRGDRQSKTLTAEQATNLLEAALFAELAGMPLTRFITIHWQKQGVPERQARHATASFLKEFRRTLARHKITAAFIWVLENGSSAGAHVHILAHVPAGQVNRLTKLQRRWIIRISGQPYRKGAIKSLSVGSLLNLETSNPELYRTNMMTIVDYMLKQRDADTANWLNLRKWQAGGTVTGKRCGTSQNIGRQARLLSDLTGE